jgi:hypothetical protein
MTHNIVTDLHFLHHIIIVLYLDEVISAPVDRRIEVKIIPLNEKGEAFFECVVVCRRWGDVIGFVTNQCT